jgi:hypothetical protein
VEVAGDAFILDIGQRERKTRGYNVDQLHREQVLLYGIR